MLALQKQHKFRAAEVRYYSLGKDKGKEVVFTLLFQGEKQLHRLGNT